MHNASKRCSRSNHPSIHPYTCSQSAGTANAAPPRRLRSPQMAACPPTITAARILTGPLGASGNNPLAPHTLRDSHTPQRQPLPHKPDLHRRPAQPLPDPFRAPHLFALAQSGPPDALRHTVSAAPPNAPSVCGPLTGLHIFST